MEVTRTGWLGSVIDADCDIFPEQITLLDKVSVAPIIRENASVGIFFLLCIRWNFLPVMCW